MADIVTQRNIAAYGGLKRLSDQGALTAGGGGDAASITGGTVDRENFANGSLPNSAEIGALFSATLASGKTLSVAFDVQDSADGAAWSDYFTQGATAVATGPSGGGVVTGQSNIAVNLTSARRYVRTILVPDLSATGTDTAVVIAAGFFGGFDSLPAPTA